MSNDEAHLSPSLSLFPPLSLSLSRSLSLSLSLSLGNSLNARVSAAESRNEVICHELLARGYEK